MPNFIALGCLEVGEKFNVVGGLFQVVFELGCDNCFTNTIYELKVHVLLDNTGICIENYIFSTPWQTSIAF